MKILPFHDENPVYPFRDDIIHIHSMYNILSIMETNQSLNDPSPQNVLDMNQFQMYDVMVLLVQDENNINLQIEWLFEGRWCLCF